MAKFFSKVCIRGDNDVLKVKIDLEGKIESCELFKDFVSDRSLDIISDDIGDIWVSDFNRNIKKIP